MGFWRVVRVIFGTSAFWWCCLFGASRGFGCIAALAWYGHFAFSSFIRSSSILSYCLGGVNAVSGPGGISDVDYTMPSGLTVTKYGAPKRYGSRIAIHPRLESKVFSHPLLLTRAFLFTVDVNHRGVEFPPQNFLRLLHRAQLSAFAMLVLYPEKHSFWSFWFLSYLRDFSSRLCKWRKPKYLEIQWQPDTLWLEMRN